MLQSVYKFKLMSHSSRLQQQSTCGCMCCCEQETIVSAKRKSFAEEQKQAGSSKRAAALRLKERDPSRPPQGSAPAAAEGDETSATRVAYP